MKHNVCHSICVYSRPLHYSGSNLDSLIITFKTIFEHQSLKAVSNILIYKYIYPFSVTFFNLTQIFLILGSGRGVLPYFEDFYMKTFPEILIKLFIKVYSNYSIVNKPSVSIHYSYDFISFF